MRQENRNTSDLPPTIPDYLGCPRFPVFISLHNLGWSANSEIPDCLGFPQHMKTRHTPVPQMDTLGSPDFPILLSLNQMAPTENEVS